MFCTSLESAHQFRVRSVGAWCDGDDEGLGKNRRHEKAPIEILCGIALGTSRDVER